MRLRPALWATAGAAALAAAAAARSDAREIHWDALARRMTGRFTSEAQAIRDPDYFDVRCEVVPLWPERTDGRWLYVERAVPGSREAPYRQTVYRLGGAEEAFDRPDERRFELAAFSLSDPRRFAGGSLDPSRLASMTPADLVPRPGCAIVLVRDEEGDFTGGTRGRGCPGEAEGVAYVTSEWRVGKDALHVWDRGYDAEGRQVSGATKGAYLFRRIVASSFAEPAP